MRTLSKLIRIFGVSEVPSKSYSSSRVICGCTSGSVRQGGTLTLLATSLSPIEESPLGVFFMQSIP
jgi:hypothetical protein